MAQAGKSYTIEALNGNNYYNWKFRMEMILAENEVSETILKETDLTQSQLSEKEKAVLSKKEAKAKSLIVQCVEDNQLECLRDMKTAFQMWETLREKYEKKGLPGQLYLKKKLLSMKLQEEECLEAFILQFEEVTRKLKCSGAKISDEDLICNILLSLPKSYETIVTVIENTPNMTFEMVKTKLIAEYEKRKLNKVTKQVQDSSYAFHSQNRGACFKCGEIGHFKRDCKKDMAHGNASGSSSGQYRRGTSFERTNDYRNGPREYGFNGNHRGHVRNRLNSSSGSNFHRSNYAQNNTALENNLESNDESVCFFGEVENEKKVLKGVIQFFIDSGCTDHMVNEKSYFSDLVMLEEPIKIAVAKNDNFLLAMGVGNIKVVSTVGKEKIDCTIKNVFYIPNLRRNLLSVKRLEMSNIKVLFENAQVRLISKEGRLIGIGKRENLYEISFQQSNSECLNVESMENGFMKWHKRYGHIGFSGLREIINKGMVVGIEKNIKIQEVEFCEPCVNGKITRFPFGTRTRSERVLEIIHSDVCGPITPQTYDGYRYFVTFIDDFSNFSVLYLIKGKDEVYDKFREFVSMVQAKFNEKISKLRCDNGGEYVSNNFKNFCRERGIILDYTVPYTPQQNGKAERKNRSLVERSRAIIEESGVPKEFWGEAIRTVNYIMNRGTSASLNGVTPAEIWYHKKPDVSNLRVFGCLGYSHILKEFRNKFDSKTEKCIMMGYSPTGYRLWSVEKQKIIISRDVEFNENSFFFKNKVVDLYDNNLDDKSLDKSYNKESKRDEFDKNEKINEDEISDRVLDVERDKRNAKLPSKYDDYELYMAFDACSFVENVPSSFSDIQGRPDSKSWMKAIGNELKSIEENETWEMVKRPDETDILDTKWVFTYKNLEEKEIDRYKARLVVRGFAQENKKYDDIYSPVAKMTTIRSLLVIGNQLMYHFQQLDVKTAFLNGTLNEIIYIYPPQGTKYEPNMVFKLKKSLYGLKQSSKCWNDEINKFLLEIGFIRSNNDYCLYILNSKDTKFFLLIYVDDIILTGPDLKEISKIKNKLMSKFQMKDKGELKHFLGLKIEYDREKGILRIDQSKYTESILKRFNMENCKASVIPIDPKLKINLCDDPSKMTQKPFRELVGCLMYLMLGTRPDICFSVNFFSRFQDKATNEIWVHLKRVLRYLKSTINVGLEYYRNKTDVNLCCYVDADWGSDILDRKSVTGYTFKVFGNIVMWSTRKQACVSLSTTEAELVALSSSVCDGLWLRKLFHDFDIQVNTIIFYEDNQGCLALIKNPSNNRRVKHIDLKFNFICEHFRNGVINIVYIESSNQQADILTKGLPGPSFVKFRSLLGLKDFSERGC